MTVLATLKDGRIIAKASIPTTYIDSTTPTAVSATISELRKVESLLNVNLSSVGNVGLHVTGTSISGNVVGITVVPAAGTTVTGEIVCLGY
jgi:hypothetical protein